jgi:hypothetical protein
VKISSLFKDKAFAFAQAGDVEDDCSFALKVLKKVRPTLKVKEVLLWGISDYCDIFLITDDNGTIFKFKISLSDPQNLLKREATALRSFSGPSLPILVKQGTATVGEEISYLLTKVPFGESVRNYGRSSVIENLNLFLSAYWEIPKSRPVRNSYKKILHDFTEELIPKNCLPEETISSIKEYTDYEVCEKFLLELKDQILKCYETVSPELNKKCHGNLSIDSVFYYNKGFYFDDLYNVSMGHPYIDFVDLLFEMGGSQDNDILLWKLFCEQGNFTENRDLYHAVYEMQIRKKLAELLLSYIKEIYLYGSYRYEEILNIADSFSHCYERFCKIPIFKEKRRFIMKTICEPIFGVKA